MYKVYLKSLLVVCAGAALATAFSHPAHAANRCDMPQVGPEYRACVAAKQGPAQLRRFVERTQGIYGLYYKDFAKEEERAAPPKLTKEDIPDADAATHVSVRN